MDDTASRISRLQDMLVDPNLSDAQVARYERQLNLLQHPPQQLGT